MGIAICPIVANKADETMFAPSWPISCIHSTPSISPLKYRFILRPTVRVTAASVPGKLVCDKVLIYCDEEFCIIPLTAVPLNVVA